ncbi:MAG: hypothetical protein FWG14_07675 [Peptococcaceae bacterium]|nr:hypothetical protein [Peptococcaceae bacterium]
MAIRANVRHYYLEAYTPRGHISLVPDVTEECLCTYYLMGNTGLDKSTFIKMLGIQLSDRCYDVDYIRQACDPDLLAGLFLPGSSVFIIDINEFGREGAGDVSGGSLTADRSISDTPMSGRLTVRIDLEECVYKAKWEERRQEIEDILARLEDLGRRREEQLALEYPQGQEGDDHADFMEHKELPRFYQGLQGMGEMSCEDLSTVLAIIKTNKVSFCFLHALQGEGWTNCATRYLRNFDRICVDDEDSDEMWRTILDEIKSLGQRIEIVLHPIYPFRVIGIIFPWKSLALWRGNPVKLKELGLKECHGPELAAILEEMRRLRQRLKSLAHECAGVQRLDEMRNDLIGHVLGQVRTADS